MSLNCCGLILAIFDNVTRRLEMVNKEHPWQNCVAIGVDNTNVNIGKKNSIKTRVNDVNDAVYIQGCPCHVIHNTAKAGASSMSRKVRVHVFTSVAIYTTCKSFVHHIFDNAWKDQSKAHTTWLYKISKLNAFSQCTDEMSTIIIGCNQLIGIGKSNICVA